MKKLIGLSFFCFLTILSFAQTFKGIVIDNAGNPVSYAALYLKEMKSGFTTDDNGRFQTKLPKGQYTCEVSSLGFITQTFTLQMPGHDYEKNLVLAERVYSLPEVSVTRGNEDPAYAVMRKAIARAPYHRTQVKSFKAGTYLKGTGKGESIPTLLKVSKQIRKASKEFLGKLFVLEEQQQITFTAPDTWNSKVIAYKNSFPDDVQVNMGITTVNLYIPKVFGRISPLNKNAFSYYNFRLDACYEEGGHVINKIRVIPKRENSHLVEGDCFIVEDLWCVSATDFNIWGNGMKAHIKVTCKEVQPTVFLPVSTTMSTSIDVMGFKAEGSYLAAIHYTDVKTDAPVVAQKTEGVNLATTPTSTPKKSKFELPSRIMNKDKQTDSLAGKRDSLYWASVRSVPLQIEEVRSYDYLEKKILRKDSLPDAKQSKGTDAGKVLSTFLAGKTFSTTNTKAWLTLPDFGGYVPEYNFVDGFWLGVRLKSGVKLSPSSTLQFLPSVYYATARKRWMGQGELVLDYAPLKLGRLSLSGGIASADYNGESGESSLINSFSSAFFGHNHVKLYERTSFTVNHAIEPFNGLLFTSSLSWQRRKMLDNHIRHSWFKRDAEPNIPGNNSFQPMPDNDILKASFGLEFTPEHYYRMSKGRKIYEDSRYPTFALKYDRAFPMTGTQYITSYHLMQFSARQKIEFGMFNRVKWAVNAGTFWNAKNLQFPDFKHFASTRIWLTEHSFDTGFSLLDNYVLSTHNRWAQANISWYTPYLLLKQLPFLSKKFFDEALHLRSIARYGQRPYTELGYSVGLSDMARVGVFVGFENLKYRSVGISVSLPFSRFATQ